MTAACNIVAGLWPAGRDTFVCTADAGISLAATVISIGIILVALWWLLRQCYLNLREGLPACRLRDLAVFLIPLAALLTAIAAGGPAFQADPPETGEHVVVVVDHSDSAHRRPDSRKYALDRLAQYLRDANSVSSGRLEVSLLGFGAGPALMSQRRPAAEAVDLLLRDAAPASLQRGDSAIVTALREAARLAAEQPDGDAIVLVSDGNDTVTDLEEAAEQLSGAIPVTYTLPIDAGMPSEGIVSAYLPPTTESGARPYMRVVFDPGADSAPERDWTLSAGRNGTSLTIEQTNLSLSGASRQVRLPIAFDGRGVQFADIAFSSAGARFARRLFTLVKAPVRVLALGNRGFLSGLPADRFEITPTDSLPDDLGSYDVVVLGEVDAGALPAKAMDQLASGIRSGGLGLLLVNGPLRGDVRDPSVVMSYKDTPLDLLLPVSADPRFLLEEPPPRDIIVMVDVSGSMAGEGIDSARRAIRAIADQLRPVDRLKVITFDRYASNWLPGTSAGRSQLEGFLAGLRIGGVSDASAAFQQAAQQTGNYAATFLITDGEVAAYDYKRDGMNFIYLEVGSSSSPRNASIVAAANESQMLRPGQGLQFTPKFLKPEERTEFFTPETIAPRVVEPIDGIAAGIETSGLALTYARADAKRVLISNKGDSEPVLALREAGGLGGGRTAAFLSGFSGAWTNSAAGRSAIERIIEELATWSQRDRYDIRFADFGTALGMRATALPTPGAPELPDSLLATLVMNENSPSVALLPLPGEPGAFEGRLNLPTTDNDTAQSGVMILEETGGGSITGRQVIPVMLPGATSRQGNRREATSSGYNKAGLEAVANASGGAFDRLPTTDRPEIAQHVPPVRLHLFFLSGAALLFGLGMLGKELRL